MAAPSTQQRPALVAKELRVPFLLLLLCFAAWGTAANLTDVLVGVFRSIFTMTILESSLVQFAYYGAYFLLAIPAAMINQRFGFKAGLLTGLGLAAIGGFLFFPAAKTLTYAMFLLALFTLAAGLSILETSANPLVIAMGDETTSTRRLNLAQAFNPIGAHVQLHVGMLLQEPGRDPGHQPLPERVREGEGHQPRLRVHQLCHLGQAVVELVEHRVHVVLERRPGAGEAQDASLAPQQGGAHLVGEPGQGS